MSNEQLWGFHICTRDEDKFLMTQTATGPRPKAAVQAVQIATRALNRDIDTLIATDAYPMNAAAIQAQAGHDEARPLRRGPSAEPTREETAPETATLYLTPDCKGWRWSGLEVLAQEYLDLKKRHAALQTAVSRYATATAYHTVEMDSAIQGTYKHMVGLAEART